MIEKARERQRRERLRFASIATLLAAGIAAGVGASVGGTGHARTPGAGHQPGRLPVAARRTDRPACTPVFGAGARGAPSRSLLSILGVLRRPAGSVDKLPSGIHGTGDPFFRYVRRTRLVGPTAYYLYPAVSGCQPGHVGLMDLATPVDLGHGLMGGSGGGGANAAAIEAGHAASTGPPESPTSATITMVVPDGVASVTLRYPPGRASGYSPKISPAFTVTTKPVENEVVVRVPRSAGGGPIWQPTMTWRAADGRAIRTFHAL